MKILFQGDSITDAGRNLLEGEHFMGQGYPVMVTGQLGLEFPGCHEFINRGISGNRVVDVYARIKRDIINLKPDFMSILIGVNDVWHEINESPNGVDNDKYFKIYSLLIEEIKAALPEIQIMILEPFVMKGPATEEHWDIFKKEVDLRAQSAKKIAETYGLTFVPLQEKFDAAAKLAPETYWLSDGVHPTQAGHALITGEWVSAFKKMV
ncbi:MAG: SGNH/GDSL hydrolase family protein [Clostridia bacterium]|nr:SGNH/GDSL hydrolase family protein [Clostridia bacterium]